MAKSSDEKQFYNISRGVIGTSAPGEVIKDTLSEADIESLTAAGLISEKMPLSGSAMKDSRDLQIATLKGQLIESRAANEKAKSDFDDERKSFEKQISDLTAKNKELKKLAGA